MKKLIFTMVLVIFVSSQAASHCQIPCGIYDDQARIKMISENITTIEKSINSIEEISKQPAKDYNQLIRWVNNKEAHAGNIQDIVYDYFMAQRINPVQVSDTKKYNDYIKQLTLLHELGVYAMKSKQSTDLSNVAKMRDYLARFEEAYFNE